MSRGGQPGALAQLHAAQSTSSNAEPSNSIFISSLSLLSPPAPFQEEVAFSSLPLLSTMAHFFAPLQSKLPLPPALVADQRAPRALSEPLFCLQAGPRPGLNGQGLQRGTRYHTEKQQDGDQGVLRSLAAHSQSVHQGLPAHLHLSTKLRVHMQSQ